MPHKKYMTLGRNTDGSQGRTDWILPCLGLVATSAVIIALTVLNVRQWRSSESTAMFVLEQRSTIAIAVQIISHVLGWIQVQTLCKHFRCYLRLLIGDYVVLHFQQGSIAG